MSINSNPIEYSPPDEYSWCLGDPAWWCPPGGGRYSGTVLRRGERGYLVTLHDHPAWRWVEQVPAGQLVDRDETPELVVTTEQEVTVTTWNCPHPSHRIGTISAHSNNPGFARESCARYMPPLGHAHDTEYPPALLPEGVDPATVPVWVGGIAENTGGGVAVAELVHDEWCYPGGSCVECGGCDCGVEERTCDGPGCYSYDARDEWRAENGYDDDDL